MAGAAPGCVRLSPGTRDRRADALILCSLSPGTRAGPSVRGPLSGLSGRGRRSWGLGTSVPFYSPPHSYLLPTPVVIQCVKSQTANPSLKGAGSSPSCSNRGSSQGQFMGEEGCAGAPRTTLRLDASLERLTTEVTVSYSKRRQIKISK